MYKRQAHEQGAAHAADGYARATGRPSVVIATSGPGATNLVTGLATAYMDSVPVDVYKRQCKKASPSKGIIAENFPYLQIAKEYEAAGAAAVSVLTEPRWFLGNNMYLEEIAAAVSIPCLRKDFVVDEYMIYEAKLLGADAVLLLSLIHIWQEAA